MVVVEEGESRLLLRILREVQGRDAPATKK